MLENSDKLYDLIHSLNKSEKVFVKKFAALFVKEDANGITLFDIYNKVIPYNSKSIEKLVSKEKFASHIHKTKNYLYDLILKALLNYNSEKNPLFKTKISIIQAHILKDKNLFKEALFITKKIKKEAEEKELYSILIEALIVELRIIPKMFSTSTECTTELDRVEKEIELCKKKDLALHFLSGKRREVELLVLALSNNDIQSIKEKAKEILNLHEYKDYENLSSTKINMLKSSISTYSHYILEDYATVSKEGRKLLLAINELSGDKQIRNTHYNNLASVALNIYDAILYQECISAIVKLQNEITDQESYQYLFSHSISSFLQCYHSLANGNFEEGLKICNAYLAKKFTDDNLRNTNLSLIYYYQCVFLFLLGDYAAAIKASNNIELQTEQQEVIYKESDFIKILCHLEMGNTDTDQNMAKKHFNFLTKNNVNFEERKIILKNIYADFTNKKKLAQQTLSEIENRNKSKDHLFSFGMLDVSLWCKTIKNISTKDLYRNNYKEKIKSVTNHIA